MLSDVSILVAVGIKGDAVVVSILESGRGLAEKLRTQDITHVFAPLELPGEAGLYWFAGRSECDRWELASDTLCEGEWIPLNGSGSAGAALSCPPAA